ncbi:MAG: efflux RND transporter periplasmic adaptor subunit [Bacteroidia bacterium]|nr:efflux RND transporter periplasmic adaptor subunit [Bacteroidia bacterium]
MKTIKLKITSALRFSTIILVLALTACSGNKDKATEEGHEESEETEVKEVTLTKEQFDNSEIRIGQVESKNLNGILKVNGKLDVPPQNLVSVSVPIGGFLKSTEMLEGMHVVKGQVVAVIEHPEITQLQQDFVEAKSKYDYLEQELKRQQDLNQENVNSVKVLQQTQSEFNIAQAKYKALEERMRMAGINKNNVLNGNITGIINVTSPINGYVTKVNVNIGKMINQQDVMFEIVDTEHLHAELTVFEKDITKIKVGQRVRFTLANDPNKELTATVHLIGRSFDETRSVRIHCHLDKEDKDLLPGMFINAIVELDGAKVISVPANAIVKESGKEFIFVKEDKIGCGKHEECTGHEMCEPEEDCPEHPNCEKHEKCKNKATCEHKECAEHENCKNKDAVIGYRFTKIEIKSGITDGKFTEINPLEEIEEGISIVTEGAFFLLSQSKMGGEMDSCGH